VGEILYEDAQNRLAKIEVKKRVIYDSLTNSPRFTLNKSDAVLAERLNQEMQAALIKYDIQRAISLS
jgi:hypothetical protein